MRRSAKTRKTVLAAALAAATMLTGCADMYYDRRDTMQLSSGDAVATNRMTHMVDPWPPASGNRNIAFDGERARMAAERYRTDRVKQPVATTTSSANYQAAQQATSPSVSIAGGATPKP